MGKYPKWLVSSPLSMLAALSGLFRKDHPASLLANSDTWTRSAEALMACSSRYQSIRGVSQNAVAYGLVSSTALAQLHVRAAEEIIESVKDLLAPIGLEVDTISLLVQDLAGAFTSRAAAREELRDRLSGITKYINTLKLFSASPNFNATHLIIVTTVILLRTVLETAPTEAALVNQAVKMVHELFALFGPTLKHMTAANTLHRHLPDLWVEAILGTLYSVVHTPGLDADLRREARQKLVEIFSRSTFCLKAWNTYLRRKPKKKNSDFDDEAVPEDYHNHLVEDAEAGDRPSDALFHALNLHRASSGFFGNFTRCHARIGAAEFAFVAEAMVACFSYWDAENCSKKGTTTPMHTFICLLFSLQVIESVRRIPGLDPGANWEKKLRACIAVLQVIRNQQFYVVQQDLLVNEGRVCAYFKDLIAEWLVPLLKHVASHEAWQLGSQIFEILHSFYHRLTEEHSTFLWNGAFQPGRDTEQALRLCERYLESHAATNQMGALFSSFADAIEQLDTIDPDGVYHSAQFRDLVRTATTKTIDPEAPLQVLVERCGVTLERMSEKKKPDGVDVARLRILAELLGDTLVGTTLDEGVIPTVSRICVMTMQQVVEPVFRIVKRRAGKADATSTTLFVTALQLRYHVLLVLAACPQFADIFNFFAMVEPDCAVDELSEVDQALRQYLFPLVGEESLWSVAAVTEIAERLPPSHSVNAAIAFYVSQRILTLHQLLVSSFTLKPSTVHFLKAEFDACVANLLGELLDTGSFGELDPVEPWNGLVEHANSPTAAFTARVSNVLQHLRILVSQCDEQTINSVVVSLVKLQVLCTGAPLVAPDGYITLTAVLAAIPESCDVQLLEPAIEQLVRHNVSLLEGHLVSTYPLETTSKILPEKKIVIGANTALKELTKGVQAAPLKAKGLQRVLRELELCIDMQLLVRNVLRKLWHRLTRLDMLLSAAELCGKLAIANPATFYGAISSIRLVLVPSRPKICALPRRSAVNYIAVLAISHERWRRKFGELQGPSPLASSLGRATARMLRTLVVQQQDCCEALEFLDWCCVEENFFLPQYAESYLVILEKWNCKDLFHNAATAGICLVANAAIWLALQRNPSWDTIKILGKWVHTNPERAHNGFLQASSVQGFHPATEENGMIAQAVQEEGANKTQLWQQDQALCSRFRELFIDGPNPVAPPNVPVCFSLMHHASRTLPMGDVALARRRAASHMLISLLLGTEVKVDLQDPVAGAFGPPLPLKEVLKLVPVLLQDTPKMTPLPLGLAFGAQAFTHDQKQSKAIGFTYFKLDPLGVVHYILTDRFLEQHGEYALALLEAIMVHPETLGKAVENVVWRVLNRLFHYIRRIRFPEKDKDSEVSLRQIGRCFNILGHCLHLIQNDATAYVYTAASQALQWLYNYMDRIAQNPVRASDMGILWAGPNEATEGSTAEEVAEKRLQHFSKDLERVVLPIHQLLQRSMAEDKLPGLRSLIVHVLCHLTSVLFRWISIRRGLNTSLLLTAEETKQEALIMWKIQGLYMQNNWMDRHQRSSYSFVPLRFTLNPGLLLLCLIQSANDYPEVKRLYEMVYTRCTVSLVRQLGQTRTHVLSWINASTKGRVLPLLTELAEQYSRSNEEDAFSFGF
eukprot:TRINITY_DN3151_c0_g1_i1.p1 TRINITY_DN3151_c0_g1~~TRINITY_DN3151_c0_g1_i1.p1  ORF type:complete len:1668 (+),score=279.95 TRINITY_DN3151_c0_g1_i1:145-5004(+)